MWRSLPDLALPQARALLVLEFDAPPPEAAFAARKVGSPHIGDKEFATVPDWTPGCAAGAATRHYLSGVGGVEEARVVCGQTVSRAGLWVGGAEELKRLAENLASLSPRLASMLSKPTTRNLSFPPPPSPPPAVSPLSPLL